MFYLLCLSTQYFLTLFYPAIITVFLFLQMAQFFSILRDFHFIILISVIILFPISILYFHFLLTICIIIYVLFSSYFSINHGHILIIFDCLFSLFSINSNHFKNKLYNFSPNFLTISL